MSFHLQPQPLPLGSCPKQYTYDQDKACSPEQTIARFYERLQQTGLDILREIKRIDNGRLDIPVYFSVCGEDAKAIIGNKKQMGKGATPTQSRASACMELGERFSFFSFRNNPDNFLIGDYQEMEAAGYPLLGQETLLQSVHDTGLTTKTFSSLLEGVPMRWTWATRLSDMAVILVPFSWFYAINEFNGPSAGNTYEEAVVQGISEVIERHVCSIISKKKQDTPAIAFDSITDPVAVELVEKFRENGIELYLNDFSLDTGIPTIAALAWDPATFPNTSEIVYTAGTTPGTTKAVIRALTEVAQLAGDFNTGSNYAASGLPKPMCLEEVDHVINAKQTINLQDMDDLASNDIFQELRGCVDAINRMGLETYVINTSHPDLQIPATYTIIPGAHFRERARGGNAAMFAAKLAARLLEGERLSLKLGQMQEILPKAYYLMFYQGRHAYEEGRPEEALMSFHNALKHDPIEEDLPYLYSYKGSCLRDLARYDEAIAALTKGLSYDEERPDLHNTLGVCHFKCGQYEQAVVHFRRAIILNPASAIDHANLALNLEKLGQKDEAVEQYQVALGIEAIPFALERLENLLSLKD